MVVTKIFDPLRILLWGMSILMFIFCGILYIYRGQQKESSKEKLLMYGFASMFIFDGALTSLFKLLADMQIIGDYIGHGFYGDFSIHTPTYDIFGKLVEIFTFTGIFFYLFAFEHYIKRTRYIMTLIGIAYIVGLMIVIFLYPIEVMYNYTQLTTASISFATFIIISMVWLIRYSTQEFRYVSIILVFGYIVILIGNWMDSIELKELSSTVLYLSPLIMMMGSLIVISPMLINPDKLSIIKKYWKILAVFTIIISLSLTFYVLILGIDTFDIIMFLNYGFNIILIFILLYSAKLLNEDASRLETDNSNILGMFSRPKKLTEEEVSVSKEKKVCLVCKGNIRGINFMCGECGAFYCQKCYAALTDLENTCWSCDNALDMSKPVKNKEILQEALIADESIHKKRSSKK